MLFSFSANSSVSSGRKQKVGCTVQNPRNKKTFCQNKNPAHVHALSSFGGRGWITRAALMIRNPGCGSQRLLLCRSHPAGRGPSLASLFPPQAAVGSAAVRIHPRGCDLRCRAKQKTSVFSTLVFLVERSNPNPNHCPLGHLWRRFHRK